MPPKQLLNHVIIAKLKKGHSHLGLKSVHLSFSGTHLLMYNCAKVAVSYLYNIHFSTQSVVVFNLS